MAPGPPVADPWSRGTKTNQFRRHIKKTLLKTGLYAFNNCLAHHNTLRFPTALQYKVK